MNTVITVMEKMLENEYKGLIHINENQNISLYSSKAREITGLLQKRETTHPKGRIADGDIVIIVDNLLGDDDELTPADFKMINIDDSSIDMEDAIIAIGVYNNLKIEAQYKYLKNYSPNGRMELDTVYLGFSIRCTIDFGRNYTEICVGDHKFVISYFKSAGHMVVIDGSTGKIKFFQDLGYGFREEEIGKLLHGKEFQGKEADERHEILNEIIGRNASEVLSGDELLVSVSKSFDDADGKTRKGLYEIFKRPMYCTLMRVKNGSEMDGVWIIIQEASHLESVREERNAIIELLEQQQKSKFVKLVGAEYIENGFTNFIGNEPSMWEVKRLAYKASGKNFNVIITGESGTGKSRLAREIHELGSPNKPFVEVNCNAIAPSLFESELFGYVPGAFTGAASGGKKGFFEEANGGTLFLDEIGEIPLEIQVKLLNAIQSKKIYRVGSSKPVNVDVRIITATNKNLDEEVLKGNFRQDLFYRIHVFPIEIPPLRERKRDLYVLINSIMNKICEEYGQEVLLLSEEALNKMLNYSWPGNVRELENVLERAVTICDSPVIYSEHIMLKTPANFKKTLKEQIADEEKRIIREALIRNNNNKTKTMEELGVSKTVFYKKIKGLE